MKMIDLGCFNGDSVLHFVSYPDIESIDAYDPTPYPFIWHSIIKTYPQVKFFKKAVYTYTGEIEYSKRPPEAPLGSTIMKEKDSWDMGKIEQVECVDILEILPNEPYCLKIDVEGAEYDLLERIINKGDPSLIDRLYVEWHNAKMSSDNAERQRNITNYFGGKIKSWL